MEGAIRRAFPLLRYFALLSLGCMLLVAVPMGYVLHRYSMGALETIAEERNVGYAKLLSNSLWPVYRRFLLGTADWSGERIREAAETQALQANVVGYASATHILKVKIYDLNERIVFSTDAAQIGLVEAGNPGIAAARRGKVASTLTNRRSFDRFEKTETDREVLSSYIPLEHLGAIEAVFEIYTDVTPFVAQMHGLRDAVATTVGSGVAMLYLLLALLIWRAKRIIDRQHEALTAINWTLEARVEERTQALTLANEQLRSEMQERERAETGLRLAATVFENTGEGVLIVDRDQKTLAVNRAFSQITGYSADEMVGKTPGQLKSGRQGEAFYLAFWDALNVRGAWTGEIWNRRKSGEIFPEWLSVSAVRDGNGELTHYVGVFSDITDIKASHARLEYLAHHDVLTGLPNRVQLNRQLSAAIAEAREREQGFSLLFIDLDHFKHINDTLGHPLGDRLLHAVGESLQCCLNGAALVARVGGDEFVAVLNLSGRSPNEAAESILAALIEPFMIDEHMLYVGASIGIVHYPEHGETAETLLANADAAMYRAKGQGRNTYCSYTREMTERARDRLALSSSLRTSIEEGRLFLQYQPQIEIASGKLVGVEALVRMRHPELGVIGPAKFIELAEEDGTISRLGHWVLAESCRAMARWRASGCRVPKVAVNVSVSQLERNDLLGQISELLLETGLGPEAIEIEITESVIMNADHAIEKLRELRNFGVSVSIDDFGTGYSSLSYLRKLPVQKLKIDRSFFVDTSHGDAAAVVRGIIGLARNLGLKTVAEGVETREQFEFLRVEGCDVVQGFLFGRPLDEAALAAYCAELIT